MRTNEIGAEDEELTDAVIRMQYHLVLAPLKCAKDLFFCLCYSPISARAQDLEHRIGMARKDDMVVQFADPVGGIEGDFRHVTPSVDTLDACREVKLRAG